MIVIAYKDGPEQLRKLLTSLINIGYINEAILILDTGCDTEAGAALIGTAQEEYSQLSILTDKTPYRGYCSGAYIYAMQNYITHELFNGRFIFVQDSIEFVSSDFFTDVTNILNDTTVTSMYYFPATLYGNNEQIALVERLFGTLDSGSCPADGGVFGPMFSITETAIRKLKDEWLYIPTNKEEDMTMERGWGVMFKLAGLNVIAMEGDFMPHMGPPGRIVRGRYINKYFLNRQ